MVDPRGFNLTKSEGSDITHRHLQPLFGVLFPIFAPVWVFNPLTLMFERN